MLPVLGFLALFLLYQIPEANGQDLLRLPWKPYSTFVLFLLVVVAAELVARWQGADGLASYGMGLHPGWWQNYLYGLGLGVFIGGILEFVGIRLGVRRLDDIKFSIAVLFGSILWVIIGNFPAAAAEDLITRGYPYRFLSADPLPWFILLSATLYTLNHVIRLVTKPITDWYHLPFAGLYLAYALIQTGSLWYVIGLHQSGNLLYYLMHRMSRVTNTTDTRKRIVFGIMSELIMLALVILVTPFAI